MLLLEEKLSNESNVDAFYRDRKLKSIKKTFKDFEVDNALSEGWQKVYDKKGKEKTNKRSQPLEKPIKKDILFENKIWCMLYDLGFENLNIDRNFYLNPSSSDRSQVDIYCEDEDIILIFECKSASTSGTQKNFNHQIEKFHNLKNKFSDKLSSGSGGKYVRFIFATEDYEIGNADKDRLKAAGIDYWDDDITKYFLKLSKELKSAGKYQMLSILMKGQKVKTLNDTFPALKCIMGGKEYFNFAIEPSNLLKISTIPHRHHAYKDADPSYQRFVNPSRLKQVNEYIAKGNIFPNALIVSINEKINFEEIRKGRGKNSNSSIGTMRLPKKFGICNIIDGQHRVYGYAQNSKRAKNDFIPVVAFENLSDEEQMKIFTDINTNQKNVPKDLINDLKRTLWRNSEDLSKVFESYYSEIVENLNSDKDSPLFGTIKIGENERSSQIAKITSEAIIGGMKDSYFFGKTSKLKISESGLFYFGDKNLTETKRMTYDYLISCFQHVKNQCKDEWEKGSAGFLLTPHGVRSLIRVFSEILCHITSKNLVNPLKTRNNELVEQSKEFLNIVTKGINKLDADQKSEIKGSYGGGGYIYTFRSILELLNNSVKHDFSFKDTGFKSWLESKPQIAQGMHEKLVRIEYLVRTRLKHIFEKHNSAWEYVNIDEEFRVAAKKLLVTKEERSKGNRKYFWYDDGLNFEQLIRIIGQNMNSKKDFSTSELRSDIRQDFKIEGEKDLQYLQYIKEIRNDTAHYPPELIRLSPKDKTRCEYIHDTLLERFG